MSLIIRLAMISVYVFLALPPTEVVYTAGLASMGLATWHVKHVCLCRLLCPPHCSHSQSPHCACSFGIRLGAPDGLNPPAGLMNRPWLSKNRPTALLPPGPAAAPGTTPPSPDGSAPPAPIRAFIAFSVAFRKNSNSQPASSESLVSLEPLELRPRRRRLCRRRCFRPDRRLLLLLLRLRLRLRRRLLRLDFRDRDLERDSFLGLRSLRPRSRPSRRSSPSPAPPASSSLRAEVSRSLSSPPIHPGASSTVTELGIFGIADDDLHNESTTNDSLLGRAELAMGMTTVWRPRVRIDVVNVSDVDFNDTCRDELTVSGTKRKRAPPHKGPCEHGVKQRSNCKVCSACPHGRRRAKCKECGGASICEHGRERYECKECGGKGICEHGRVRSQCKECGGGSICEHGRQRSHCKECGGGSICEHGRMRSYCKECGGSQICEHGRRRDRCKECQSAHVLYNISDATNGDDGGERSAKIARL